MTRSNGGFQVQRTQCATCIYRKDSTLNLAALERACADKYMPGFFAKFRRCHHSTTACCNGFWTRHKDKFALGQIAQRLGFVEFVNHDTMTRKERRR